MSPDEEILATQVAPLPSAFITNTQPGAVIAILVMSGDQAGFPKRFERWLIIVGSLPSAFITMIALYPKPPIVKAILLPSGDHAR